MNRSGWGAAIAALTLAVACGRGPRDIERSNGAGDTGGTPVADGASGPGDERPAGDRDPSPGDADPARNGGPRCEGLVTLRLRGANAGAIETFDVQMGGLDFRTPGAVLSSAGGAPPALSLAGVESQRLVVLRVPAAGTVEATLRPSRVHACAASRCQDLDLCTAPIDFRFDLEKVNPERCHVVLQLDLARSLQPLPGGDAAFLPQLSVHY